MRKYDEKNHLNDDTICQNIQIIIIILYQYFSINWQEYQCLDQYT
jgi:hypothetical protein